jgi:hypothetical protein
VPSERGPLVTHYGSIQKEMENPEHIEQYYFDILDEILSVVNNGEPIFTFSLDRNHVLFSTCFAEDNNQELIDWHLTQTCDDQLNSIMDFYHYPMSSKSHKMLNIGVPKNIRQSFQANMSLLKSKLNGLSVGIFSAETGARQWMQAEKYESYLIWKIGKKKIDEFLFIRDGEMVTYFSFHRSGEKGKMMWQFGDSDVADSIVQDILKVQNEKSNQLTTAEQVYIYTSDGSIKEVKSFHQMKIENLTLLNPLSVIESTKEEKIHEYNTLPLAETGNAFGGVDV